MANRGVVQLSALSDGSRTVAEATLHTYRHPALSGTGSSGREPGDKADAGIGEDLALARALRSLAARLERQANGRCKHRADVRAQKKAAAGKGKGPGK